MLEFLIGKIYPVGEFDIVIDIGNFGFRALSPSEFEEGKEYKVYTKLFVKEEEIKIFAFKLELERTLFLKLININGVGVKQSLKLLREFDINELLEIIENREANKLTKVSGIGKKLAQRIIFELSGKLEINQSSQSEQEVLEALTSLGYPTSQVKNLLKEIDISQFPSLEIAIKELLKLLSEGKKK
jgi:Holliday junction DNA helicase RuvA